MKKKGYFLSNYSIIHCLVHDKKRLKEREKKCLNYGAVYLCKEKQWLELARLLLASLDGLVLKNGVEGHFIPTNLNKKLAFLGPSLHLWIGVKIIMPKHIGLQNFTIPCRLYLFAALQ